jgi:hypothetical protein
MSHKGNPSTTDLAGFEIAIDEMIGEVRAAGVEGLTWIEVESRFDGRGWLELAYVLAAKGKLVYKAPRFYLP